MYIYIYIHAYKHICTYKVKCSEYGPRCFGSGGELGATTLSITTFRITPFSITSFSVTPFSITPFSITKLIIMALSITFK